MWEYKLRLCEYKLSPCFLSPLLGGRKYTTFLGHSILIFPKMWCFFGKILFSPISVPLRKCSTVGQGRSGVRFPPGPLSLGRSLSWVWICVSWIWRARGVRHNFGTLTPSPIFPKNLPLFWDFHPGPNFPKNLPQFWNFSRIQTLGTFVLRFRYFEFTACDCRSLEFTRGPTDISSLLVVGTSVFLVPLTLHWKKAADIGSPS